MTVRNRTLVYALTSFLLLALNACVGSGVSGNEGGSAPVNDAEVNEYKRAVHRCYKTGGTRVVKINGKLRCYD